MLVVQGSHQPRVSGRPSYEHGVFSLTKVQHVRREVKRILGMVVGQREGHEDPEMACDGALCPCLRQSQPSKSLQQSAHVLSSTRPERIRPLTSQPHPHPSGFLPLPWPQRTRSPRPGRRIAVIARRSLPRSRSIASFRLVSAIVWTLPVINQRERERD